MKIKREPWMTCLGILLTSCLGVYILLALYWFPYETFRKESLAAVPKFDALNEAVLVELPLPQGAIEVERHSWGVESPDWTRYDRMLEIDYLITDVSGVLDVYKKYFIDHGWRDSNPNQQPLTAIGFYRDVACVSVWLTNVGHGVDAQNGYHVHIYHDFLNQDFSPKIPKLPNIGEDNLLEIYHAFKFSVGTCPHHQLDLFGTE